MDVYAAEITIILFQKSFAYLQVASSCQSQLERQTLANRGKMHELQRCEILFPDINVLMFEITHEYLQFKRQ